MKLFVPANLQQKVANQSTTFGFTSKSKSFFYLCLLVAFAFLANQTAFAQSSTKFNDGYLTVFKVSSVSALANTGTAITVEEYKYLSKDSLQSTPNFSVAIPSTFGSPNRRTVVSGSATSAGAMTRSENGRYLIIPGYDTIVGAANSTFTLNAALRTVNASGTVGVGVQGNGSSGFYANGSNNLRGGISDDGTNFWAAGNGTGTSGTNGIQYSANGTTITNVTASQNGRVTQIYNGQLYMSLAGALHQIGTGKPTSSTTPTSILTLNAGNTSVYSYAVSPDFLTIYTTDDGANKGVYRYTYSGTYSGGTYSGGSWSSNLITAVNGCIGIAVDWSNYSFSTSANGARIFYNIPLRIFTALDNGTSVVAPTTLRVMTGTNNAFRGLSFSPIKQTVSRGANSPATGNISVGNTNVPLFQFNLSADEGNSTIKKVVISNGGTANLGGDIINFRLYDDINGDGIINGSDSLLSIGTGTGPFAIFSSINLSTYIAEGSSKNFLVVGDIASNATLNRTFIPSISTNKTLNTVSYTSNLTNGSSSFVTIGTTAPTGNTITITSANPLAPSAGNQTACFGATIPNITATPSGGETIDWYADPTGGTALATGSTSFATGQTAAGVYTYYAEARNTNTSLVSLTRTAVTLTINSLIAPTLDIDASDLQPAPGDPLELYINNQTNQGSSPTYQWYKNGNPISLATGITYSTTSFANGDQFYLVMTSNANCVSPTSIQSNTLIAIVNTNQCSGTPPTTNTVTSSASICSGATANLSLSGLGASTGYTFQWQSSTTQNGAYTDVSGQTNSTYPATITVGSSTSFWYKCVVTCSGSSLSTTSNPVQVNITANVNPSVSISPSANPSCAGASVTYTASPTNGGTSPVYTWYLNTNLVSGQTASTYTSSSFANGDQVYAVLTSNYACLSNNNVSSNTVTQFVTANVPASVSIVSSTNPSCAGASVTFTASPTNGGSNPTYQWYNGANPIGGETNSTYTSTLITTGSSITVRMTSNATCVTGSPATSNAVVQTVTANVTPSLTITSNNNPVCVSGSATFTATPINGGITPVYAWYLNGNVVSGQTADTYTLSSVANNDSVYAIVTSSVSCVTITTAQSATIKETIVSPTAPIVSIASNPGTSIFDGTNITFTATPTFGGTAPTYQWKLNGNNVGTGLTTYSSSTLSNGDIVTCAMVSNYTCATTPNATSNSLTITILSANPFTPGNILVYKVGDSANALINTGNPVYLNEYTPSGTFVQSKRLTKNTTSSTNLSIVASGTATSEGMMALNTNGLNVAVPGYYAYTSYPSSLTGTASATVNRICELVDINQNIDTTTKLSDWSTGNNPRGVTANGDSVYVLGGAGGIRYALRGATTSTQLSTTTTNLRFAHIANGQLYVSASSGATRVATVGTGIPKTSGQTITNIPGAPTAAVSPYGFYFADLSSSIAGVDVVYVADDNSTGTITKYSLVSGSWVSNGSVTAGGVRGLTGSVSGSTVRLFATGAPTGASYVYSLTDNGGYNAAISGSLSTIVDRSSVSLIAFRGICFTPTQFTSQPTNASGCTGSNSTFSVTMATGTNAIYTYQWQTSSNGGSSWSAVTNNAPYSNTTTATLSIANPSLSLDNAQYRCVVTYMGNAILTSNAAVLTVNQTVTPSVSISTDTSSVCSGSSVTFTASATNGGSSPVYQWKKNGVDAGSGSTITFLSNTLSNGDVISCVLTANNNCQTTATANSNAIQMTVKQSPSVAQISNGISTITSATLCTLGSTYNYYCATGFGTWSSSNPGVASVAGRSLAAVVTANTNGTATISYNVAAANGCVSTSSILLTLAQQAAPTAISGTNSICVNATTALSSTAPNGTTAVWSSSNNRGIINASGVYTGQNAGTGEARYTVTNTVTGCKAFASYAITVNATPVVPTIAYAPGQPNPQLGAPAGSFCVGKKFRVTATPNVPLGVWSTTGVPSLLGLDTISINGVGAGTIKYTYTSAAGCSNSRTLSGNGFTCASRGVNTVDGQLSTVNGFAMYPNPAKGLINLYGKSVKTQNLSMGTNTVNISNLSKGMYFVSTITNEGKTTKKLVVE
jgi:hypothetical protein